MSSWPQVAGDFYGLATLERFRRDIFDGVFTDQSPQLVETGGGRDYCEDQEQSQDNNLDPDNPRPGSQFVQAPFGFSSGWRLLKSSRQSCAWFRAKRKPGR
jgi:hypothetical protein